MTNLLFLQTFSQEHQPSNTRLPKIPTLLPTTRIPSNADTTQLFLALFLADHAAATFQHFVNYSEDTVPQDNFNTPKSQSDPSMIHTNNHCSFVGHPADCNVSTFRGESRGRLKRLNANTRSGSGGRRRTIFQYDSCDRSISSALRAVPFTPSTQKACFNLFMWRLLPFSVVDFLKLLSRQSRAKSFRCSTYSNPCSLGAPVKPSSHR
ncbi:unnamed protein product [Ectocarpus sp. 6 AP-2014]